MGFESDYRTGQEDSRKAKTYRAWVFKAISARGEMAMKKEALKAKRNCFQRNRWVPVPIAPHIEELNRQRGLLSTRTDSAGSPGATGQQGGDADRALPTSSSVAAPFGLAEISNPTGDGAGCVRVRTNSYLGCDEGGQRVQARIYLNTVGLW